MAERQARPDCGRTPTVQAYSNRFTEKGRQSLQLKLGSATYTVNIDVEESGIDISEATYGLQLKLDATGRSNEESNPATWESNGVTTSFEGVDWASSGWVDGALRLTNGAKAVIHTKPFSPPMSRPPASLSRSRCVSATSWTGRPRS